MHAGVVDDHVVCGNARVVLSHTLDCIAEKTIGQLHDVGLVDDGDLLTVICKSERIGEFGNALGLCAGDDLQRLDDARCGGMLKTTVFTFCVFTDDTEVNVLVACFIARDVLEKDNVGVDVEFLAQSNIERDVTRA